MILLLVLMQAVDPDEVVTAPRLFAKTECRRSAADGEILVCARRNPDRLVPLPARPDPTTIDRRPQVKIGKDLCLRVGLAMTVSAC